MWKVIGTSLQGRGHIERGIPCQDAIFQIVDEDLTIIALADGAGSATHSHYGATAITEGIAHFVKVHFNKLFEQEEIEHVRKMLFEEIHRIIDYLVATHNEIPKAFGSTLLLVAVKENRGIIIHLGDGEIGAIQDDQLVHISSGIQGEFANATIFTTSKDAALHTTFIKSENAIKFDAFFMMSDGSSESLFSKQRQVFAPVIQQLSLRMKYGNIAKLNKQLAESFKATVLQKTKDDCSFIMMTNIHYESMTDEDIKHLQSILPMKRKPSFRKIKMLVQSLEEKPMTLQQLARQFHWKRRIIRPILRSLLYLNVVECSKGRYSLVGVVYD